MSKRTFTVLRGLPGAGKNHLAERLAEASRDKNETVAVFSTDDFFTIEDDEYHFDSAKLGEAHATCAERVFTAFAIGYDHVIVANTNTQRWEYAHYVTAAKGFGYQVDVEEIACPDRVSLHSFHARCVHEVALATMANMWVRWERDPLAIMIAPEGL